MGVKSPPYEFEMSTETIFATQNGQALKTVPSLKVSTLIGSFISRSSLWGKH